MFKIVSDENLELPRGAKFTCEPQPLETGKLYLFQVGAFLIVGRWYPGWIIQPGRWIEVGKCVLKVLGQIRLLLL